LVRRGSPTEAASGGQNNVVRPTAGGSAESCGAGFTPASGGGAVAEVWISAPQAGINPAPQIPRPPRDWRWRRTLWGRLYAGQREWGRCRSVDFTAVGRDKPGPTDSEAARNWRWRRTLWGRLHAGQREWGRCRSVDFTAVGRDKPGPTDSEAARNWRWRRTLWGRLYAGQRGWGRCRSVDLGAAGRDKPGPTDSEAAARLALTQDLVGPALRRPAGVGPLPMCGFRHRRPG